MTDYADRDSCERRYRDSSAQLWARFSKGQVDMRNGNFAESTFSEGEELSILRKRYRWHAIRAVPCSRNSRPAP
jgi:hypothetical protein